MSKFKDNKAFIFEFNRILEEAEKVFELEKEEDRKTELNMTLKKIIRSSEAKVALNFLGLNASKAYTLELPFYGDKLTERKKPGD